MTLSDANFMSDSDSYRPQINEGGPNNRVAPNDMSFFTERPKSSAGGLLIRGDTNKPERAGIN